MLLMATTGSFHEHMSPNKKSIFFCIKEINTSCFESGRQKACASQEAQPDWYIYMQEALSLGSDAAIHSCHDTAVFMGTEQRREHSHSDWSAGQSVTLSSDIYNRHLCVHVCVRVRRDRAVTCYQKDLPVNQRRISLPLPGQDFISGWIFFLLKVKEVSMCLKFPFIFVQWLDYYYQNITKPNAWSDASYISIIIT